MEIHSKVDTITIRGSKRECIRRQPRLRIYGNLAFLDDLTELLASEIGTGIKKPQRSTRESEVSGTLYYQSPAELRTILDYLYEPPVDFMDREYYDQFIDVLRQFEK